MFARCPKCAGLRPNSRPYRLTSTWCAEWAQPIIEHNPVAPFRTGSPKTAPKPVYDRLMAVHSLAIEAARKKVAQIGAKL